MHFTKLSLCTVAFFGAAVSAGASLNQCTSGTTQFSKGLGDWTEERGLSDGWEITEEGLVMKLEAPKKIVRMTNASDSGIVYIVIVQTHMYGFSSEYK